MPNKGICINHTVRIYSCTCTGKIYVQKCLRLIFVKAIVTLFQFRRFVYLITEVHVGQLTLQATEARVFIYTSAGYVIHSLQRRFLPYFLSEERGSTVKLLNCLVYDRL